MSLPQLDRPGDPKAARAAGVGGSWLNGGCGGGFFDWLRIENV